MPPRSPPKHRHDGTSPLPLGMDWSPPPKRWTGRDTVWPHDPRTGWSYCVSIPSWTVQPELGSSDSLNNPIVFYRVQVGIQSPDGISSAHGVLRRFSDFLKLSSALKKSFSKKNIPPAPPKHALLRISSSRLLLEERRYALEEWMERLLSDIDLSRSIHMASFLELEAAARSSFQDANTKNADSNPADHTELSTTIRLLTGPRTSIGNSVASAGPSLASDNSSENAYEAADAESPRHETTSTFERTNEGLHSSKEVAFFDNRVSGHHRKNSSESIVSDVSSIRGSEVQNTILAGLLYDGFDEFLEGEASEARSKNVPQSITDLRVFLPLDQRHKLNRILLTMQRRLVTVKTDMEDLISRLNQEVAVKEYLSTKVKDLEGELENSRQKSKENMQQAILLERERITQMQWELDELQRKRLEMEPRLYSEQKERMRAESEKAAALSEREALLQELGAKKEELRNLQGHLDEVEMKSRSDLKVLVKEVKMLRKSQADLMDKLSQSVKEKAEAEKTLQKEKGKWEDAKRARIRLLHECGVLRDRLENCQVDIFSGEEISLMTDSASMADALDLLETSDNRIGLLLAEAQLLGQDDGFDLSSSMGDAQSNDFSRNPSSMNGEDGMRESDFEVRKMLTKVFIDNAVLRKHINAVSRIALKTKMKTEKEEADGSFPARKTVLTKFLER